MNETSQPSYKLRASDFVPFVGGHNYASRNIKELEARGERYTGELPPQAEMRLVLLSTTSTITLVGLGIGLLYAYST